MKTFISNCLAIGAIAIGGVFAPLATKAEIHSRTRELVVMEPRDLPELAQMPGDSLFIHSDDAGSTYLYIEQQRGARLVVFDVTDPSRIKFAATTPLATSGAFDFVRALGERAELIRFRDGKGVAVLDLHKATKPALRMVSAIADPGLTSPLGETGFLGVDEPYNYVRTIPRDYQVVDISTPSDPMLLTTVKQVQHRVVNDDTGTTFLLGSGGLTVVRRISVEQDYKTHLEQMKGN